MKKWYLMSAYALTEKKRAPVTEVQKHWNYSTVFAVKMSSGKKMFACAAGGADNYSIGDVVEWVKDTGMGHAHVPYNERELTIENIITVTQDGIVGKNDVAMTESRAIYVFK